MRKFRGNLRISIFSRVLLNLYTVYYPRRRAAARYRISYIGIPYVSSHSSAAPSRRATPRGTPIFCDPRSLRDPESFRSCRNYTGFLPRDSFAAPSRTCPVVASPRQRNTQRGVIMKCYRSIESPIRFSDLPRYHPLPTILIFARGGIKRGDA